MGASTLQTDVAYTLKAVGVSMVQEVGAYSTQGADLAIGFERVTDVVPAQTH
jgi:hypothetical protein